MEIKQVEIFSETTNHGIVRMPGRKFPGCVIQGDSLSILLGLAQSIKSRLIDSSDEQLRDDVDEMCEALTARLAHYISVLDKNGMDIPFNRSLVRFDVA